MDKNVKLNAKEYALFNRRLDSKDSLDDFPTPPWATRALLEKILGKIYVLDKCSVLEPACNRGFMSRTLMEYFGLVQSSDIKVYCENPRIKEEDFLKSEWGPNSFDWVITNPPFNLATQFILKGLTIANIGVAVLVRTNFLEGQKRFSNLFQMTPPWIVAQFVERVPMLKGRLEKNASTATSYAWLIWMKRHDPKNDETVFEWIPPCRKELERENDYKIPNDASEK